MGDKKQRHKTWDIGWKTKYKDVKEGTNDVILYSDRRRGQRNE